MTHDMCTVLPQYCTPFHKRPTIALSRNKANVQLVVIQIDDCAAYARRDMTIVASHLV